MYLCPNCEVPLSTADLRAGSCPVCHTVITPDMETIPTSSANRLAPPPLSSTASPTNDWGGAATDDHATLPIAEEPINHEIGMVSPSPRHRRRYGMIAGSAAVALAVVLIATLLMRHSETSLASTTAGQSKMSTATTLVSGTKAPAANASAMPMPTRSASTPTAGTPTATTSPAPGTPIIIVTATPQTTATAVGQPILNVSPRTFSLVACVNAQETFTIANQGAATLRWLANTGYTLNQTPGPLAAGATVVVTASGIYQSGTVIISATDLAGHSLPTSPQTITVTCTL